AGRAEALMRSHIRSGREALARIDDGRERAG
ncbi:MAG: GntR family transcriptional regulator, partial [Thauera phenolivorans]|nr:GntR family transcriptional regulator [Thauera phenolivorans]